MPIMDVRYATGSLNTASKAVLAERLTDVLVQMEGGANTEAGRAFAWVCFTEIAEGNLWIAAGGLGGVIQVDPRGVIVGFVPIPAPGGDLATTNLAFGGRTTRRSL